MQRKHTHKRCFKVQRINMHLKYTLFTMVIVYVTSLLVSMCMKSSAIIHCSLKIWYLISFALVSSAHQAYAVTLSYGICYHEGVQLLFALFSAIGLWSRSGNNLSRELFGTGRFGMLPFVSRDHVLDWSLLLLCRLWGHIGKMLKILQYQINYLRLRCVIKTITHW